MYCVRRPLFYWDHFIKHSVYATEAAFKALEKVLCCLNTHGWLTMVQRRFIYSDFALSDQTHGTGTDTPCRWEFI